MYLCNRISQISSQYDAFIVDLWGVIHDGERLYPSAIETLEALKKEGKKVIFLSNAPRRAIRVIEALGAMGIGRHLYMDAISSGELCYRAFEQPQEGSFTQSLIGSYTYIGPQRDRYLLTGLPLIETASVTDASFLVATGFDHDDSVATEKMPELHAALTAGIPMICVNPDRVVVKQTGERALCAGILGEIYEELGGKVYYFGKPYKAAYEACFAALQESDKSRIIMIGDSLETDIRGASQAGIDSILLTGGILAEELGVGQQGIMDRDKCKALCQMHDVSPTYVMPAFIF